MVQNLRNLLPMEGKRLEINGYSVEYHEVNTLVIGSGAASLNAAVSLHSLGQEDILIATEEWGGGTSNNAGSDKQTYYKLSLCGDQPDSVTGMARDLFNGRCMHGDIALCEAIGSVRAFMNLAILGVPFPHDKYGAYAGYKTDHDPRSRATSAGPRTSLMMFDALAKEVRKRKIKILDRHQVIRLITDHSGTRAIGAIAINRSEKNNLKAFVLFNAVNIVMGTGGPGGIYETTVYPLSQNGSTGIAFEAGASGQNLTESQFGIASTGFRWNLSGSYQQVIPRYFSARNDGTDEREFLNEVFPDYRALTKAIFLKGYQWPFDPGKIEGFGSSLTDLLVFREREERGRRVWIDFRRNPSWKDDDSFRPDELDPVVYEYLYRSGALQEKPVERLKAMNSPAMELYRTNGIDLLSEPVEAAVCAQHNNGGLKGNIWWESDLLHLFPVGEVNGSHGVFRPGGSALNSGQVGSYRAARFITSKYKVQCMEPGIFLTEAGDQIAEKLDLASGWYLSGKSGGNDKLKAELRKRMSAFGGIIRNSANIEKAAAEAAAMLDRIDTVAGASSVEELADCFTIKEHTLTHYLYLDAIRSYIRRGGRSRGSYLVTSHKSVDDLLKNPASPDLNLCRYDIPVEEGIIEVRFKEGQVLTNIEKVREIPSSDLWFGKVWKEYNEDNYF